jgi:hypothetical protein
MNAVPEWATEPTYVELDPPRPADAGDIAEHLAALWARDGRTRPGVYTETARSTFLIQMGTRVYEVDVTDVTHRVPDWEAQAHCDSFDDRDAIIAHMREIHPVEAAQYDAGSPSVWEDMHLIAHKLLTPDAERLASILHDRLEAARRHR